MNIPAYRTINVGLIRAPLLPASVFEDLDERILDPNQLIDLTARRLGISSHLIREAIRIASPDLHQALSSPKPRTLASIRRYLIRMCTRATPFGYFAGAAPFQWSQGNDAGDIRLTRALFSAGPSKMRPVRPADEPSQSEYKIFVAPSCRIIAGRLYCDVESADSVSIQSLKVTPVIESLLGFLVLPRPFLSVANQLTSTYDRPLDVTIQFLHNLVARGFLVTDSVSDQLRHSGKGVAHVVSTDPSEPTAFLSAFPVTEESALSDSIYTTEFAVDGCLDRSIADRAATLASILLSVNGGSEMRARMESYVREFLERYGPSRVVGLVELVDRERGLGIPSDQLPRNESKVRESILIDLFAAGLRRGNKVDITKEQIEKLQAASGGGVWPESLDIVVTVLASGQDAIRKGAFGLQAAPNPGCIGAGRHASRFCRSNPQAIASLLEDAMDASRVAWPGAMQAELRFVPLKPRTLNVISGIHACDVEIVDCPTGDHDIDPRDIGVTVYEGRIQVVDRNSGREICPHTTHMVNPRLAPRLHRALIEFRTASYRTLRRFNWGVLAASPVLPEIRYGEFVLSAQEWNPPKEDLDDATKVAAWRERWRVPPLVLAGADDNRLLLDLARHADVVELIRLARNGPSRFHVEACPHPEAVSWLPTPLGNHTAEIVVSLVRKVAVPETTVHIVNAAASNKPTPFLPGSRWVYFQLVCSKFLEDRLLVEVLLPLVDACDRLCDRWFYIRYTQPDLHIRLRLRSRKEAGAEVFAWAAERLEAAVRQSLCTALRLDTFTPEVERYGGDAMYDFAERLFEADSLYSLKLLAVASGQDPDDRAVLAIRLSNDLMDCCDLPLEARARVAEIGGERTKAGGQVYRKLKVKIAAALESQSAVVEWEALLAERRRVFTAIIGGTTFQSYLQIRLDSVRDLLHMQLNRFLGVDRAREDIHFELLARAYDSLRNRRHFKQIAKNARAQCPKNG